MRVTPLNLSFNNDKCTLITKFRHWRGSAQDHRDAEEEEKSNAHTEPSIQQSIAFMMWSDIFHNNASVRKCKLITNIHIRSLR